MNSAWKQLAKRLNLQAAEPICHEGIRRDFEDGNAAFFVSGAYASGGTLALVCDNVQALLDRGIYEAALVEGFVGCKGNLREWKTSVIELLFKKGDWSKPLSQGSRLPGPGPFTVYRGVSGEGEARKPRGLSWTLSIDVACKFALGMCPQHDPAVYEGQIDVKDIYCYYTRRGEYEIIGRPRVVRRLKLSLEEMRARRDRLVSREERRRRAKLKRLKAKRAAGSSD